MPAACPLPTQGEEHSENEHVGQESGFKPQPQSNVVACVTPPHHGATRNFLEREHKVHKFTTLIKIKVTCNFGRICTVSELLAGMVPLLTSFHYPHLIPTLKFRMQQLEQALSVVK